MSAKTIARIVGIAACGLALAAGGYWLGRHQDAPKTEMSPTPAAGNEKIDPKTGRKVLYWHDPMVPGQKFDKPGKSPFMDMPLVPVYADEAAQEGGVKINPTLQHNLGIRYATVKRTDTAQSFSLVGTTQFDESLAYVVQSRVTGYIDRLQARTPMQRIARGAPIATLFSPDWIAPQEEYLALKRSGNSELASAARQRMRALSIPEGVIQQAERTGQAQRHITLSAPASGVLTELNVREGAMVSPGMTIAKVAGLEKLWLVAEVPESLTGSVKPGMPVEATLASNPARKYSGSVREVLPGISTATRTLQARLVLDNRDGNLTPGLLMQVSIGSNKTVPRLVVPSEAVIATGKRTIVLVAGENNAVVPANVTTGQQLGDDVEILSGLTEGQKVVASGQFLIDSEASLKAVLPRLSGDAPAAAPPQHDHDPAKPTVYHGVGKVEKVSPSALTLSHRPIPELQWGAMTMDFNKPQPQAFPDIRVGQNVQFSFRQTEDGAVLESVTPAQGGAK